MVESGASVLRRLALADARKCGGNADRKSARAHEYLASRSASRQSNRYRSDRSACAVRTNSAPGRSGRRGRRDLLAAGASHAYARIILPPDAAKQCASDIHGGPARDFRSSAGRDDLPNAARSGRAGEQYGVRAGGQRLERKHQRGAARRRPIEGRRGVGKQHKPVRRGIWIRRLQRKWVWPRRWPRRSVRISRA